jgi:3-hydroxyacyl-[acyl-carrier-protein] dehydratase
MEMTTTEIMKVLPHRYPFLLVDRILECIPGKYARGIKNVTINEPFFTGHLPGEPIMPGVLMLEAMAQVAAVALLTESGMKGKHILLGGVERSRFRCPVTPGDQLEIESSIVQQRPGAGLCQCTIRIGSTLVADAKLLAVVTK